MPHVMLVEDDPQVRSGLIRALTEQGFAVSAHADGSSALSAVMAERPDLVVLDLGLPGLDGYHVLQMLRAVSAVPVIIATARDDETEIVKVLNAGADDYLVKPFGGAQLAARIKAVLRRGTEPGKATVVSVGELTVDGAARTATLAGYSLDLSPREFDLLRYLADRVDQVVTKRELLAEVWHLPYGGADKTVDVHLSWLRRKMGETAADPQYLHTVRAVGVRLTAPDPAK